MALGALAVAALPALIGASELASGMELLRAVEAGAAAAFLLGLLSLLLARLARRAAQRTVRPEGVQSSARWGRRLGALGVYLAVTAGVALAFYATLKSFE